MHIAFLSPTWPPGLFPNGIVTYVNWMRRGLMAQGHRVSVFTGVVDPAGTYPALHQIERSLRRRMVDIARVRLLGHRRSVFDAGDVIADAIRKVHQRDPFDVIEMEESFGWAAAVARQTGIPMVVKLHGPAFMHLVEEDLATPHGQEKVLREGVALSSLPVIIAPALFTLRKTLTRYGLQPKIGQQVVNPVALAEGAPLWQFDVCERDTILFVGRFDKVKGGDLILLAFQRLLALKPHLKLVFVGPDSGVVQPDGSKIQFDAFIRSRGDAALTRAVSYRGRLAPSEVAPLRAQAMVTVVASRHENQAYTVLEAMLQGCPVVCTDNSGSSESVAHEVTGLLTRTDDPADMARQIKRLVDDPALAQSLGTAARAYVLKVHAPEAVVAQTVEVYRQAIALSRAREAARD